jgi:hypothetical protein
MSMQPPTSDEARLDKPALNQPPTSEIDLQALAEKIYRLLINEARIERERLGWRSPRR